MTEQTTNAVEAPKSATGRIVGNIVKYAVLLLLGFTIFMAAARKFGWF
jgi:hypothetical protein